MSTAEMLMRIGREGLFLVVLLSAPIVLASLAVGLVVSVFQATTQIQEQTLTFVPKLIITIVVIAILGPWGFYQLISFTSSLFTSIPTYIE